MIVFNLIHENGADHHPTFLKCIVPWPCHHVTQACTRKTSGKYGDLNQHSKMGFLVILCENLTSGIRIHRTGWNTKNRVRGVYQVTKSNGFIGPFWIFYKSDRGWWTHRTLAMVHPRSLWSKIQKLPMKMWEIICWLTTLVPSFFVL